MNAVEIDEAVSALAAAPYDAAEFPFQFLAAFGFKDVTLKRLRRSDGGRNASDVPNGVLLPKQIHIATAAPGELGRTFAALRQSQRTASAKPKFILATDGTTLEAEDLASGEPVACDCADLGRHLGFFLPLAGISTVKEIRHNPVDVKATGRLNKLYIELLRHNPEWAVEDRRPALNRFMSRLIFCFFAEDTGIFSSASRFTTTVRQMSATDASNTHEIIGELFRAMGTRQTARASAVRSWADNFPFVNGDLFTGDGECPRFTRIALAYLLRAGELDWKEINPDIFGSMIQAVADEGERGALGMHYTSVPNILKVLNPLFLDDLREQLDAAADNARKLRNLRKRLSSIRVFDPACGSGNFLVVAFLHMREIEAEIVRRTGDVPRSVIPLRNFYGIEIRSFPAEIARLALLIAEFQADCRYIGQQEARAMVLPLHKTGQITVGNALRIDWLTVCPPTNERSLVERDLASPTGQLALDGDRLREADAPETYICGNPPYLGSTWQSSDQKADLAVVFQGRGKGWRLMDYVSGWFLKVADYGTACTGSAFVSTKSICQGQQVPVLWPIIFGADRRICFAYRPFSWANLATRNAGVTVTIIGLSAKLPGMARLFAENQGDQELVREVDNISPYLVSAADTMIFKQKRPISALPAMDFGSKPADGGGLLLSSDEARNLEGALGLRRQVVKPFVGSDELINGRARFCLWFSHVPDEPMKSDDLIQTRLSAVSEFRLKSDKEATRLAASQPHRFAEVRFVESAAVIVIPRVSSERRAYLPINLLRGPIVVGDRNFALYDQANWSLAVLASRLHWVWIGTVCVRLRTDFSYSNTLGWNTFPVPPLTDRNKADLTRCAENILLAREAHFPATIADLYDPETMPDNLRRAHEENDETLERIYIGRRFRNDTERLEKLFELYGKMIAEAPAKPARRAARTTAKTT